MKMLVVHPGATYAIADVYNGLFPALQKEGVELYVYALDHRIEAAGSWLTYNWKRSGKVKENKPGPADFLYLAGSQVIERALYLDVDWVLIVSGIYFLQQLAKVLQKAGLNMACLFTESPYEDPVQLQWAQYMKACWITERSSVDAFRAVCPNTFYLKHAYDPSVHFVKESDRPELPSHDVLFIGSGFPERIDLLSKVNWSDIDFGLYGEWGFLGSRSKLRKHLKGKPMLNKEAIEYYRRAKIVPNIYRTSERYHKESKHILTAESLNPRAYELAACGTFSISNWRPEVSEVFGDLLPTFKTSEEFEDLLHKYLSDEGARMRVAAQLPEAVQGHTFTARARQILSELEHI